MAKRSKLSKVPSRLIRMALDDLNRIEKLKGYTIAMGSWHDTYLDHVGDVSDPSCHVCLAGTVMASTLGADINSDVEPGSYDEVTKGRLMALDDFRIGEVGSGFYRMGLDSAKGSPFDREIPHYGWDRRAFKLHMRRLARDLEKARL